MFCKDLCSIFQNNYFLEHPWLPGLNNLYQSIDLSIYLSIAFYSPIISSLEWAEPEQGNIFII